MEKDYSTDAELAFLADQNKLLRDCLRDWLENSTKDGIDTDALVCESARLLSLPGAPDRTGTICDNSAGPAELVNSLKQYIR